MISPSEQKVIQIEITNACINKCSNCTRFCGHHRKPFMMDFDTFKKAVDSMKGYKGIVGMMGGEPTLHPQFAEFAQYFKENFGHDDFTNASYKPQKNFIDHICKNVFHIENNNQRGLWSSVSKFYSKNFELIQDTFGYQALNDHSQPSLHESLMVTRKELGIKDEEWLALRDNCWVQRLWSSSITPKGAFFCEIAAAMDMLLDGPGGWPIEPGWWKRTPDEFGDQLKWCELCGAALAMPKRDANEGIDDASPCWQKMLTKIRSPKLEKNQVALFDIKNYNKNDYTVINESLPYLKDQSKRMKNSYAHLLIQNLAIAIDMSKVSKQDILNTLKYTTIDLLLTENEDQDDFAKSHSIPFINISNLSTESHKQLIENTKIGKEWILLMNSIGLKGNPLSLLNQYVFNKGCIYQKYTEGTNHIEYQLFNTEASSLRDKINLNEIASLYPERKIINIDYNLTPKFSVIIPVYNAEKYLENIANQLLNQTIQNFEVIFVNDASNDNSLAVLSSLSNLDSRIKVYNHDENKYQGAARNTALNNALGEYILYIDADDSVTNNYIETLYNALTKDDSDMVICNSNWEYPNKIEKRNNFLTQPDKNHILLEGEEAIKRFFNLYEKDLWVPVEPWGKIIKRSIIEENKLRNPDGLMEDIVMSFAELIFCKKVTFINEYLYTYNRKNCEAMTLKQKGLYIKSIPNAVKGIIEFLKNNNLFEKHKDLITMYYLRYLTSTYSFFSKGENFKEEMLEAMNEYANLLEEPLEVKDKKSASEYIKSFYNEMKHNDLLEAFNIIANKHPSINTYLNDNFKFK